jgi:hypothetical protein
VNPFELVIEKEKDLEASLVKKLTDFSSEWERLSVIDKLHRVKLAMIDLPTNATLQGAFSELKKSWYDMQQTILEKHCRIFTNKENEPVGYTFTGQQNNIGKWIICGTEQFVRHYQSVINPETQRIVEEMYPVMENPTQEIIDGLDKTYSGSSKFERFIKFLEGNKIEDSGWKKIVEGNLG